MRSRPRVRSAAAAGHQLLWRRVAARPQVGVAVKAALAVVLAWSLVQPLGGVADDFPYYAPLGAVTAVSATVVSSFRLGLQTVTALALGTGLALVADHLPLPLLVSLALAITVGSLLSGWRALGSAGSWVPVSALFVLILGQSDPMHFVLGYVGLVAFGVAVGTAVNLVLPQLLLMPASLAESRLLHALAEQLDELADGLTGDEPPTPQEWQQRQRSLQPRLRELRSLADDALESRRANWRARRHGVAADRQYRMADSLERLTTLVEELTELLCDRESSQREDLALGASLRPPTVAALRATAHALRQQDGASHGGDAHTESIARGAQAVAELARAVRDAGRNASSGMWTAATVVITLERVLAGLEVREDGAPGRRTEPRTIEGPPPTSL